MTMEEELRFLCKSNHIFFIIFLMIIFLCVHVCECVWSLSWSHRCRGYRCFFRDYLLLFNKNWPWLTNQSASSRPKNHAHYGKNLKLKIFLRAKTRLGRGQTTTYVGLWESDYGLKENQPIRWHELKPSHYREKWRFKNSWDWLSFMRHEKDPLLRLVIIKACSSWQTVRMWFVDNCGSVYEPAT